METNFQAPLPPSRTSQTSQTKLSPCPSRMAGRGWLGWLGWLGARYGIVHLLTSRTAHSTHKVPEARAGAIRAGGRLAPRFPAKGTHQGQHTPKGSTHPRAPRPQGRTCEVRHTGTAYISPASLPITSGVLAWQRMHGILVSWAVLQVWRESDDVLPLPGPTWLQHKWHAAQRTRCMHATPAADTSGGSTGSLARSLVHWPRLSVFSPSELSRPARVPLSRFPVINPQGRTLVMLRPSPALEPRHVRACLFLILSVRSPLSRWPVHPSPRLIIKRLCRRWLPRTAPRFT